MGLTGLHHLAHAKVVISSRGHQGLVGDAEHLALDRQSAQQLGHRPTDPAAHPRIDLVKQQGDVGIRRGQTGFER